MSDGAKRTIDTTLSSFSDPSNREDGLGSDDAQSQMSLEGEDVELEEEVDAAIAFCKANDVSHSQEGSDIGWKYIRKATKNEMMEWVKQERMKKKRPEVDDSLVKKLCICLLCEANLKGDETPTALSLPNTSNRKQHLKRYHPTVLEQLEHSKKLRKLGISKNQATLNFGGPGNRSKRFGSFTDLKTCQILRSVVVGSEVNLPDSKWQNPSFREGFGGMLRNALDFAAENPDFDRDKIISTLFPAFKTRQKYGREVHAEIINRIQQVLNPVIHEICMTGVPLITVVTDTWSYHGRNFMGAYIVFDNVSTKKQEAVLIGFQEIKDRHTGQNLKRWLVRALMRVVSPKARKRVMQTFKIEEANESCEVDNPIVERLVGTLCADGASNNKKTAKLLDVEFIHCIPHRLNLCLAGATAFGQIHALGGLSLDSVVPGSRDDSDKESDEFDVDSCEDDDKEEMFVRTFQTKARGVASKSVVQQLNLRCKSRLGGHRVHLVKATDERYNKCKFNASTCPHKGTLFPGADVYTCFQCSESYCVPCFMSTCHRSHPIKEFSGKDHCQRFVKLTCDFCQCDISVDETAVWYGCEECTDPVDICVDCRGLVDLTSIAHKRLSYVEHAPTSATSKDLGMVHGESDMRTSSSSGSGSSSSGTGLPLNAGGPGMELPLGMTQNAQMETFPRPGGSRLHATKTLMSNSNEGVQAESGLSPILMSALEHGSDYGLGDITNPSNTLLEQCMENLPRRLAKVDKKIDNNYNLFRKSSMFRDLLAKTQVDAWMKPLFLLRSPPTRWTAWYAKVDRFLCLHKLIKEVFETKDGKHFFKDVKNGNERKNNLPVTEAEIDLLMYCIVVLREPYQVMTRIQDPKMTASVALWKVAKMRRRLRDGPFPSMKVSVDSKEKRYVLQCVGCQADENNPSIPIDKLPDEVQLIRFRLLHKLEFHFGDAALSDLECGLVFLDPRTRVRIAAGPHATDGDEDGETNQTRNEHVSYGMDEQTQLMELDANTNTMQSFSSNGSSSSESSVGVSGLTCLFGNLVMKRGKQYLLDRINEGRMHVLMLQQEQRKRQEKEDRINRRKRRQLSSSKKSKKARVDKPLASYVNLGLSNKRVAACSNPDQGSKLASRSSASSSSDSAIVIEEEAVEEVDMLTPVEAQKQLDTIIFDVVVNANVLATSDSKEAELMNCSWTDLYPETNLKEHHTNIAQVRPLLSQMLSLTAGSVIAESSFSIATNVLGTTRLSMKPESLELKMMHKINVANGSIVPNLVAIQNQIRQPNIVDLDA